MATPPRPPARQAERPRTHRCGQPAFVNAVLYVLNTGIPWDDLPERLGKPNTVWKRYDRWCASGVWERVAAALGDAAPADETFDELQLDSTSIKAHPTASTGWRLPDEKKKTPTRDAAWADPAAG